MVVKFALIFTPLKDMQEVKNVGSKIMILTRKGLFWIYLQCDSLWHYSVSHSAVDKITTK